MKFLEKVSAIVVLILLSPALVIIALAVKLDSPGPVFYRCKRWGANGTKKEILKFRTMHIFDESRGPHWANTLDDSRVSKVGVFLRRTYLDELPQLIFVAMGRFSFLDLNTSNNPLYTRVVSEVIVIDFIRCIAFLFFGGAYYWLSLNPHPFIYGVLFLFSVFYLADLVLILYRYKTKAYGNSAQELQEVLHYLKSQKSNRGGDGNYKQFYPTEEAQVLDIDNKIVTGG